MHVSFRLACIFYFGIFKIAKYLFAMPIAIVLLGIFFLFLLIAHFKLNAFIAFILVSIFVGVGNNMAILEVIKSIETGLSKTLGSLILILSLGTMLVKLVADSGAAQQNTAKLVAKFGNKNIKWAVVLTSFIVGIPMLASLSVTHGYLPPHPAPTGIAVMFKANIGKTLLYGIIVAIPAIIVAGAGALKEVLIDSGVSQYIGNILKEYSVSPLVLAWLIASIIHISVGSATVAGLTAAGIALPLLENSGGSPELMALAIGSGSIMLSHVNDVGFWLFKEYFNLSIKDTLKT